MDKEFILYEQALELKELGFDELCFGYYNYQNNIVYDVMKNSDYNYSRRDFISAPLYQQAFKFFRDKYNIDSEFYMNHEYGIKFYAYLLLELKGSVITHLSGFSGRFETHEETQLECVKKLIEILKK